MRYIYRSYAVSVCLVCIAFWMLMIPQAVVSFPLSSAAWSDSEWEAHCLPVRTSYNPHQALSNHSLSLKTSDPRFLDFLYWVWANKIIEHQVEQMGGTGWDGPKAGVIFHWAPGSRWETHTTMPLDDAIHH